MTTSREPSNPARAFSKVARQLGLTRYRVGWLLVAFGLMLWAVVSMLWDHYQGAGSVPRVGWFLVGLVALVTALLAGLYRSSGFEAGSPAQSAHQFRKSQWHRISGIVIASAGLGMALWLILLVLALIFSGADGVTRLFLPWVLPLLALLCSPLAVRWFGR